MGSQMGYVVIDDGWRKGPWTTEEDRLLIEYVKLHGEGRWNSVARLAGLRRNGKSCRLRWVNYLRPDLKRGQITPHEENIILELHAKWGNRWSTIARSLPGRTDNEIKNYWRTHFKKKVKVPSDAVGRAKNRFLKRQQFLLQQQLQQQQQQQPEQEQEQQQLQHQHQHQLQQQIQFNPMDMKAIVSLLDDNDYRTPFLSQARPEIGLMYPTSTCTDDQGYFFSMLNENTPSLEAPYEDSQDMMWDGLWNFYDFHNNFSGACATSKTSLHNLVAPSC